MAASAIVGAFVDRFAIQRERSQALQQELDP
jgi:hypothetical protein